MKTFGEIVFEPFGIALRVFCLLLIIGQLFVAVDAFFRRRGVLCRLSAAQLLLGLCWNCVLLDGSFYVDYVERGRAYPFFVNAVYGSPWLLAAGITMAFALACGFGIFSVLRDRRERLSGESVKETLDMLPVGICFAREDNTAELYNLRMERLCTELTGKPLNDAAQLWSAVEKAGETQDGAVIVLLSGEETVFFRRTLISVDGKPFVQITACDISEQYKLTEELRSKNKKLTDLQERMKAFGEMAARLAMTEELLRSRVTVHDEMGHLLLSGKNYLDNPDTADAEGLMELERRTHRMLTCEGEESAEYSLIGVEEALESARAVGVEAVVKGELPEDEKSRNILGQAIRECAANTVKHAGGDSLSVELSREGGRLTAVLRGNGEVPTRPVAESGGLLLLRRKVEQSDGEMAITCDPGVIVTICFNEITLTE